MGGTQRRKGRSQAHTQVWCLHFDNIWAKARETGALMVFSAVLWVTRKWWHQFPPSCHFAVTPEMAFRWILSPAAARQAETDWQLNSPSLCPMCEARAPEQAYYSWIFIYKASLLDLECTLMARGASLIQQWMWKKLAKDPQGALRLSPANISSSRLMFLPLWGPEGSWALTASNGACLCVGTSSKGQHPSIGCSQCPVSLLCSLLKAPATPPAALS